MAVTADDLELLRRCVQLAGRALEDGDEPFGSLLLDRAGAVRFEDHNRVKDGDATRHPELAIAKWAVVHLSPAERARCTVYTSGEHCPMCAAAHAWVGLGRVVYAASSAQLTQWLGEWNAPPAPVAGLPIATVAPGIVADGPAPELTEELKALYAKAFRP
ncbi:nucleoside deaminase [Mycolicibacterium iranicum]|uniref:tRNA-specific adenosine deaminase n=1 Tax=Mycolicibacterium iranicum TaxID=912594 RepID=A0A178LQK6_MYCIR|nr:nucleoside deaminase [Mycolicibacterium iranicum]OAN35771.1 tRNA-specific adenosine deaminase [Mycolicibacterium iranicum]